MNVISLNDYRPDKPVPCVITLYGVPFNLPTGQPVQPRLDVQVPDGDFRSMIKQIQETGGFLLVQPDGGGLFCPWPPAAIHISPGP
jgi:hypothetical protein